MASPLFLLAASGWIRICDHSSQSGPPCLFSVDTAGGRSYGTFAAAALKLPG